jgi:hypothetical protein
MLLADWIPILEEEIRRGERRLDNLRAELAEIIGIKHQSDEEACITQYGGHQDDGGMFYAVCTRCGKHLG